MTVAGEVLRCHPFLVVFLFRHVAAEKNHFRTIPVMGGSAWRSALILHSMHPVNNVPSVVLAFLPAIQRGGTGGVKDSFPCCHFLSLFLFFFLCVPVIQLGGRIQQRSGHFQTCLPWQQLLGPTSAGLQRSVEMHHFISPIQCEGGSPQ